MTEEEGGDGTELHSVRCMQPAASHTPSCERSLRDELQHELHMGTRGWMGLADHSSRDKQLESLDFDEAEEDVIRETARLPPEKRVSLLRRKEALTWTMVVTMGIIIGSISRFVLYLAHVLGNGKWRQVDHLTNSGRFFEAWLALVGICFGLSFFSGVLVAWAPKSTGSGIPHVKAYLNGINLHETLENKTLVAKVLGISCCVACGIPVGREGPMVHAGAIISAFLARKSGNLLWLCQPSHKRDQVKKLSFNNDHDRRIFISMGAAAGVAAAFNAPIGGILFSLEEVSSFWDQQLTWTTFIAAAVSAFTVNFWNADGAARHLIPSLEQQGGSVVVSGNAKYANASSYAVWELLPIVMVGALCGLLGAAFNTLNKWLTVLRKKWYGNTWKTPYLKVCEAVFSVTLVVTLFYWVPFAFPCRPVDDLPFDPLTAIPLDISYVAHQCQQPETTSVTDADIGGGTYVGDAAIPPSGTLGEMNEMATLLLQTQESALKQLFSRGTSTYFSMSTLAAFITLYFFSAVFIYGIALPSGLFVPCMMIGAAVGRLTGEFLKAGYAGETFGMSRVSPGVYALVGAAGMLGGVTRMTISLTVILVELSNDINLLLPIMLSILSAKVVGDRFTISLYDIHIELGGATLLRSTATSTADALNWMRSARSIMATNVQILHETDATVGSVRELLRSTTHSGFPVVSSVHATTRLSSSTDGEDADERPQVCCFAGLITRSKLERLLEQKINLHRAGSSGDVARNFVDDARRGKTWSRLSPPPRHPSLDALDDDERIDLRPLMDRTPYTVNENLRLYRVCRLFQTMGLRQLVVLDSASAVVGIITRKDILAAIQGKLHAVPVSTPWRPPDRRNSQPRVTPGLLPVRPPSVGAFAIGSQPRSPAPMRSG